ncbi:MAG TPA: hypothetical protein VFK57_23075 [Vicinamibacterales bacterium]|nr:hypothetical protein [Vicinamibacterales bacterium]
MTPRLFVLAVVLLAARPVFAADPPVRVSSAVDRTAMWVADRLTYTVDIVCDRGVDILLDDLAKEKLRVNGLEVVGTDSAQTTDANEKTSHRLRYVLTTYRVDTPSLSIEPIPVRYYQRRPGQRLQDMAPAGEVVVPGAAVAYRSTLPDAPPAPGLRDRRAASERSPWFVRMRSFGLALIVVSLAPAVVIAAAAVRRRTARTAGRRSAREVRKEKRDTLERLRRLDIGTEEERRRAYDEISAAVRHHVEAAAHVPASSLTAPELDAVLEAAGPHRSRRPGARGRLPREAVLSLLTASDRARYGPPAAVPSAQDCREALDTAEAILEGR